MTEVFVAVTTLLFQGPKRHRASMIRIINTRISDLKNKSDEKHMHTRAHTHSYTLKHTHTHAHTHTHMHTRTHTHTHPLFSVTDTNTCMT